jgi:hypothetical protein
LFTAKTFFSVAENGQAGRMIQQCPGTTVINTTKKLSHWILLLQRAFSACCLNKKGKLFGSGAGGRKCSNGVFGPQ